MFLRLNWINFSVKFTPESSTQNLHNIYTWRFIELRISQNSLSKGVEMLPSFVFYISTVSSQF